MLQRIPKIVTLAIGEDPTASPSSTHLLCADEILSLINELADLHVGSVRFALRDTGAVDSLSRASAHAIRRGLLTTITLDASEDDIVADAIALAPFAIAVPLHGPALGGGWHDTTRTIATIRDGKVPVEVESRITRTNATGLLPLWAAASIAGATRWRIDCGVERLPAALTASVASMILDVAAGDDVSIIVHELPVLRIVLLQEITRRHYRVPDLRRLTLLDAADTLFISARGDVQRSEWSGETLGNVRLESIEQLIAPHSRQAAHA